MSVTCVAPASALQRPARLRRGAGLGVDLFGEIDVDNFAGGGGVGMGFELATGKAFDVAINHDPASITMHKANHPHTRHLCESVWAVDPIEIAAGRPVRLAWFSPDCKHFSRAKGAKPVEKKIRGLAWVAVRWAKRVKPRIIMLENVREFQDWGPLTNEMRPCAERKGQTFKRFVSTLRNLGYEVEWKVLNAADFGAPTHRRRLFLIARSDGRAIRWPEKSFGEAPLKPYRTAAQCIDWSIPCPSIFDRKKPLAEKTLRRIALGIARYVLQNPRPFIVRYNGEKGPQDQHSKPVDQPIGTLVTENRFGLVSPTIMPVNHGGQVDRSRSPDAPINTLTASRCEYLVSPSLVQTGYGEREGQAPRALDIEKPLGTVVAGGSKHALVTAFMKQAYGGMVGKPLDAPCPSITTKDHNWLTTATLVGVGGRAGQSPPCGVDEPARTATTKADRALVSANLVKFRGDSDGAAIDTPCPTITSGSGSKRPAGAAHALGIAAATLTQFRGSNRGKGNVQDPSPSQTASNRPGLVYAFLAKYFGNDEHGQAVNAPAHTLTTKHRHGLVTVTLDDGAQGVVVRVPPSKGVEGGEYVIADIGLRMLTPRELARCQGFPESYILTGTQSNQVARIGNSVPPQVVEALVRANLD